MKLKLVLISIEKRKSAIIYREIPQLRESIQKDRIRQNYSTLDEGRKFLLVFRWRY
ncbi:hypothetical protein ES708_23370 [subsurface metagenome]